jgi:hypothetical protein
LQQQHQQLQLAYNEVSRLQNVVNQTQAYCQQTEYNYQQAQINAQNLDVQNKTLQANLSAAQLQARELEIQARELERKRQEDINLLIPLLQKEFASAANIHVDNIKKAITLLCPSSNGKITTELVALLYDEKSLMTKFMSLSEEDFTKAYRGMFLLVHKDKRGPDMELLTPFLENLSKFLPDVKGTRSAQQEEKARQFKIDALFQDVNLRFNSLSVFQIVPVVAAINVLIPGTNYVTRGLIDLLLGGVTGNALLLMLEDKNMSAYNFSLVLQWIPLLVGGLQPLSDTVANTLEIAKVARQNLHL